MDNSKFVGSIPTFYDQHLGPVIFEPYADDLSQRIVAIAPDGPVLETACGTGRLTKHLRDKLLSTAKLVATDLNQEMIDVAMGKFGESFDVEWKQADAMALPFSDRTFAAVVSQFGMMFVPDKQAGIREAARVLRGGGLFAFNVWGSFDENPIGRIAHTNVTKFFDTDPPTFYKIPFGFPDPDWWRNILSESGFTNIDVHKISCEAVSETAENFAIGLVKANPSIVANQERNLPVEKIIAAVAQDLVKEGGDHPFRAKMQAWVFTARTV
jgi:ubiquinone/menaquinone biosynthesis C-methylase UbiE